MKKIIFALMLIFSFHSFSQSWFNQNSGTSAHLKSIYFLNESTGWAVGQNGTVIKTTDGGQNWASVNIPELIWLEDVFFINDTLGFVVAGTPNSRIYKTTNGGINWILKSPTNSNGISSIQFVDQYLGWSSNCYYVLYEILRTTDTGETWTPSYLPITNDQINDLNFLDRYIGYAISGKGKILKSIDGGITWNHINTIDGWLNAISFINPDAGWIVANGGKIFKTTDGGHNWIIQYSPLLQRNLYDVCFVNENCGWAAGYGLVIKTTDGGLNWIASHYSDLFYGVHFIDENIGWAAGLNGEVIKTTDGGAILPVELKSFNVVYSNNNVQLTWSTATELNNYGFEIERKDDKTEWRTIGIREGKGTTTEQQNYTYTDDLFGVNTHKLYYRLKQIDYDGHFEYSNVLEVNVASMNFALHQNYPNPFNPSTVIGYQLPVSGDVTLKVFDILGREVATLVNEYRDAGYHEIEFNPASGIWDLASGIYFYQLSARGEAGSFIETKKMMIVR